MDIAPLVLSGGEQGLLSVAFHPDYAKNRRLYVDYTDRNGEHARRRVPRRQGRQPRHPEHAPPALLGRAAVREPQRRPGDVRAGRAALRRHGRRRLRGRPGEPRAEPLVAARQAAARSTRSRRARARSSPPTACATRGASRSTAQTGDLWIGDVGQDAWEEVDFTPRSSPGLENYGWDVYEGFAGYEDKQPNQAGHLVAPVHVYTHSDGYSITGGFVYRGTKIPSLRGRYVFGDYGSGTVWSLAPNGRRRRRTCARRPTCRELSSFGEDAAGELYATSLTGRLYRIVGS